MKKKRKVAAGSTSRSSGLLAAARFIEGEQREWGDTMGLRWFRRLDRMVQACRDAANACSEARRQQKQEGGPQ